MTLSNSLEEMEKTLHVDPATRFPNVRDFRGHVLRTAMMSSKIIDLNGIELGNQAFHTNSIIDGRPIKPLCLVRPQCAPTNPDERIASLTQLIP
jgi:hypothetical protein